MAEPDVKRAERTLHFPEDFRDGWLTVLVGEGDEKRVHSRPKVKPEVSVPEYAEVHFSFRPFRRVEWAGLRELRPDDLVLLDASSAPIAPPDLVYLARLTGLRQLGLRDTELTDGELESVATLHNLDLLNIGSTRVTNAGLAHLQRLKNLRELHLYGTRVGDAGLAHLTHLPALETLSLYATEVTDGGLEHLAEIRSLRHIALQETAVTVSGAARLQRALPACEIALHWGDGNQMDDSTGEDLKGFPYAERAHEVRMRQAAGHEASRLRDVERPATVAAWPEAVEAWDQALQRAYPPGFWELTGLLRHGDARGLEEAIRFLEADPWFFRSGYIKERLLRYVRRAPWIPEDIARLQNVLVAAIQARDRREFRHYCSLAAWLDSPEFRSRIAVLLEHDDAGVRRRARWMLDALETQTLPPGPRKRWRPHGRTKSWRRPPSPPPVND